MITFNIATVLRRKEHFKKVLMALKKQQLQCDKINIACSYGYDRDITKYVDDNFRDSKIIYGTFPCEKKFFAFDDQEDDSYFCTFDDDINYPANYSLKLIQGIEQHERKAVVGFHGMKFTASPVVDYHKNRKLYQYFKTVAADQRVDILGTGCSGSYVRTLRQAGFSTATLTSTNMTDDCVSHFCRKNNIPLICLEHEMNWMLVMPGTQDDQCTWRKALQNGYEEHLKFLNADTIRN